MGYTRRRLFLEIELPLALPVIVAGIRIATVTTIGLVTVTCPHRPGRLRVLHPAGASTASSDQIIVGAVLSVVLAVIVDLALVAVANGR